MKTKPFTLRLYTLLAFILFAAGYVHAQTKSWYEQQWRTVDSLNRVLGRPRSALDVVAVIDKAAQAEHNGPQELLALHFRVLLEEKIDPDTIAHSIRYLEKELRRFTGVKAAFAQNLLAQRYLAYFLQHRSQFYRTAVSNKKSALDRPIDTWNYTEIHQRISNLFRASLQPVKLLRRTSSAAYGLVLTDGDYRLRPTVYDVLAHSALSYFGSDEFALNQADHSLHLSMADAFLPAERFVQVRFSVEDSSLRSMQALLLYQQLLQTQLGRSDKSLLAETDAARARFVSRLFQNEEPDSLYRNELRTQMSTYGTIAHSAYLQLAREHIKDADTYLPLTDTTMRWERLKALRLLRVVVADSARRDASWEEAQIVLQEQLLPHISLQHEAVNLPGQPARMLVGYKNITRLFCFMLRARNTSDAQSLDIRSLDFAASVAYWDVALPTTGDSQLHYTEVKIDALPSGEYLLVVLNTPTYVDTSSSYTITSYTTSTISYLLNRPNMLVLHRETGQPMQALVTFRPKPYDADSSLRGPYPTNAEGELRIPDSLEHFLNAHYNCTFEIRANGEELKLSDPVYIRYRQSNVNDEEANVEDEHDPKELAEHEKIFFFLDRSIYRPAQTLYFKAIVIRKKPLPQPAAGRKLWVFLEDADDKNVDSLLLTANEYGTIRGSFHLPASGLTGEFTLAAGSSYGENISFNVEEYKRPRFEVTFEKPDAVPRPGDSTFALGYARSFAGNKIAGARVSYNITRTLIDRRLSGRQRLSEYGTHVAEGAVQTDVDGRFIIPFRATTNQRVRNAENVDYTFHISVDVTDVNGETHSGELTVYTSKEPLRLTSYLPAYMEVDSFRKLVVNVKDLNGVEQPARVSISAVRLRPSMRLLRPRYWQRPDQFVLSREEYMRVFPHDIYADEDNKENWPRLDSIILFADTLRMKTATFNDKKLATGIYCIRVLARDSGGNEAVQQNFIELEQGGMPVLPKYLWAQGAARSYIPGDTARLTIGASVPTYVFEQRSNVLNDSLPLRSYPLGAQGHEISWVVTPADRGGNYLQWVTVRDNRVWQKNIYTSVPWWYDKQLQLSFGTYRDRAIPGSKEKWRVTLQGMRGDKVAAELLASMYDASLDQLKPHSWNTPDIWPYASQSPGWEGGGFNTRSARAATPDLDFSNYRAPALPPQLIFDRGLYAIPASVRIRGKASLEGLANDANIESVVVTGLGVRRQAKELGYATTNVVEGKVSGLLVMVAPDSIITEIGEAKIPPPAVRRNFQETAFFYPDLRTDSSGSISFEFTYPDAVTTWKLRVLALTQNLAFGLKEAMLITQKPLMVQPNFPRFLRQGDHLEIVTKIVNMTGKEMTGHAQLELFDAATGKSVDGWFQNVFPNQYFTVGANGSEALSFPVEVPYLYNSALTWRITARSGDFSDAEENTLPVLSSKILVTETLPLPMRGNGTKTFRFEKLLHSGESESLQQQGLTLEYTSNPAWYAVQALPYLMEYPYECAEQTWNRYYANALAAHILQRAPKVKAVFDHWQALDTAALQSNLEKNSELKSALLEETPWVLDAANETQRKKNIALLFGLTKLAAAQQGMLDKLLRMQMPDGSFPWFDGGQSDRYITAYIVAGIGHLQELGVDVSALATLRDHALVYGDAQLRKDYEQLLKTKNGRNGAITNSLQLLHLYARSFTRNRPGDAARAAFDFYLGRIDKGWPTQSRRTQGMIALTLHRYGTKKTASDILQSLRETAVRNEELGMYWKENSFGRSWYWQDAPIETQALLIEAFAEIGKDTATVNELRTWLIKNKQTNSWRTTTATADACYALLLRGSEWLTSTPHVLLRAGSIQVSSDTASEAGTGYFRKVVPGELVLPEMGSITVEIRADSAHGPAPSWGAAYWQYFEEMDKVTAAATPLSIERKIFREKITAKGPELEAIESPAALHVGDKVRVRLVLRVDRPMEYVHLKDLRPSCLEPVDLLSGYRWKDGLGYYQSTRDLSTNFFFNYVARGTYVFEYTLFVTHKGDFSAGLASIQCLYAPEFSAHSEGQRLTVE